MTMYNVYHRYDIDGGFGDAIHEETLIATVECTKEEIEKFIKNFDKEEAYAKPYDLLCCHSIRVEETGPITIEELYKDPYGDGGMYARIIEGYKQKIGGRNERGIRRDTTMPPE